MNPMDSSSSTTIGRPVETPAPTALGMKQLCVRQNILPKCYRSSLAARQESKAPNEKEKLNLLLTSLLFCHRAGRIPSQLHRVQLGWWLLPQQLTGLRQKGGCA